MGGRGRKVVILGLTRAPELVHSQPRSLRPASQRGWGSSTLLGEVWEKPRVQWIGVGEGRNPGGPEFNPQHLHKEAKKQLVFPRKYLQNSATTGSLVPQRLSLS